MAIDKITSKALVDCTVADIDIANASITSAKLAGSIANAKLANSTVTVNGTAIALGASGSLDPVDWQSVVVSDGSTVTTMVAGRGYFVNNTSAAGIVKLPAAANAGDTISIKDYAGNFGTNNLTIQRNSHKIQGATENSLISTDRASVRLVYVDATQGWLYSLESNISVLYPSFMVATGGTVTTSGNFKIHTFTGDGNFVVCSVANSGVPTTYRNKVDYMVVAGGGSGGRDGGESGGGGGAGGFRASGGDAGGCYTHGLPANNCVGALSVSAQTYPITVGGGGATATATSTRGNPGSNSVFSTITSTGGGAGGNSNQSGGAGGSGGGAGEPGSSTTNAGAGNTPPVSPPQGNIGGGGSNSGPNPSGGGGGGAASGGGFGSYVCGGHGGDGGNGATSNITGSAVGYAGGGGGGAAGPIGTVGCFGAGLGSTQNAPGGVASANRGSGGGGNGPVNGLGGAGGKGIVVIRYKFQ
jgi:hypothetical protein